MITPMVFGVNESNNLAFLGTSPPMVNCPICGHEINWCLDLFSFTTGFGKTPFTLTHAACVWKKEAFIREAKLAQE